MTENPTTRPAENPTATPAGDPVGEFVLDPVERAVADIALGRAVIVVDDEDRENEGDIVFAASAATPS